MDDKSDKSISTAPDLSTPPQPREAARSLRQRARGALSELVEDERVRKYTEREDVQKYSGKTKHAMETTAAASASLTRKVSQEESWLELRGAVEELTEIARSHHALILELRDRVEMLENLKSLR